MDEIKKQAMEFAVRMYAANPTGIIDLGLLAAHIERYLRGDAMLPAEIKMEMRPKLKPYDPNLVTIS